MKDRRRLVAVLAASLVAAGVLCWRACSQRVPEPSAQAQAPQSGSSATGPRLTPLQAPEFPPDIGSAEAPFPMAAPTPSKLADVLDRYKAFAVYPPWSRPHTAETEYKLTWNTPVVSDLPFSDKPGDPINYRFSSDRAHVLPGEALTSWIEAWRGDDRSKRVPVHVVEAWVMVTSGPSPGRAVQLAYGDDGANGDVQAGDLVVTNRFVPSDSPALATAQQAQIAAFVEIDGISKSILRDFTYSPREVVSFGASRDYQRDGSLVFDMDVEVHDPGDYTCEANLLTGDGNTAIAYSKDKPTWPPGPAKLSFLFFGKAIYQSFADGPYQVRDIRCILRQAGDEQNIWAADLRAHTTQAYEVETFSTDEWQSPEKTARLNMLQTLLDQAKSGENPNPNAPQYIHVDPEGNEHVVVGAHGEKTGYAPR